MKNFIILTLSVLCFASAAMGQAPKSKYNSPTFKMVLEYSPDDPKYNQGLVKFFDEIVTEAKKEKLTKKEDVYAFILSKINSGKYDVDFNGVLFYCVLEALGLSNNFYMVDIIAGDRMEGYFATPRKQAEIASEPEKNKENPGVITRKMKYYDLEAEDFIANPPNAELDTSFITFTKDDIRSLILAYAAYAKFYQGKSYSYDNKPADIEILRQAEKLAKQALKISPRNTKAIQIIGRLANGEMPYSFYNPNISEAEKVKKNIIANYDIQMLAITVANRANNYAAKYPDPFICNASKYCKTSLTDEMKANMSSKTFIDILQKYPDMRSLAGGTIARLYENSVQDKDYYKTIVYLGNEYAKFKDINKINDVHVFYFQMAISNAILKNYQDFYRYKKLFEENFVPSDAYDSYDYGVRMKNATIAVELATDKKTPEQFVQEYKKGNKTDVHKREIDGEFVPGYHETQRILSAWNEYKDFEIKIKELTEK